MGQSSISRSDFCTITSSCVAKYAQVKYEVPLQITRDLASKVFGASADDDFRSGIWSWSGIMKISNGIWDFNGNLWWFNVV